MKMQPEDLARARVHAAVQKGELVRPDVCELCGATCPPSPDQYGIMHPHIGGHHWRGYDDPLDVWWICASCNHKLAGRHDGSLTKAQAARYIWALHQELTERQFNAWVGVRAWPYGAPE